MFEITRSALNIAGFSVHWYGLLIALGVLCAVLLACRREKRLGFEKDTALNIALVCVPAAIVCARLYYVLFSWEYYAAHPGEILNIRQGGLAVYGGVIGGVLAGWAYCRAKKLSFLKGLDLAAPSIALGQAIGRWGNFLNQEAYGRAVLNPERQFFPLAVYIESSGWHYAAFFYESLWCALIVLAIVLAERRGIFERSGDIFGCYLFLYGIERAVVEGLRTDSLYLGPVRISQLLSLLAVLAVAAVLAGRRRGLPAVARWLPAMETVLLGIALGMENAVLTTVFAFILIAHTAAIYYKVRKPSEAAR